MIDCSMKDKFYFFGKHNDFDKCSDFFKQNFGPEHRRANNWVVDAK